MTQELLGLLGTGEASIQELQNFTQAGMDLETEKFYSSPRTPSLWGKPPFIQAVKDRLNLKDAFRTIPEIPSYQIPRDPPSPEAIVELVSQAYEADPQEITKPRLRRHAQARAAALYLCRQRGGWPLAAIAGAFGGCRNSAVSNAVSRIKEAMQRDPVLRERIAGMEEILGQDEFKCRVKT
jgi:hypothetical protein